MVIWSIVEKLISSNKSITYLTFQHPLGALFIVTDDIVGQIT